MDSPRIIIADDDHFYNVKARDALQGAGFQVEPFDNGLEAYRRLRTGPSDLLIISETVPQVNVLEVCRRVKNAGPIPIILLSQRLPAELIDDLPQIDNYVDYFLVKPYSTEELTGRVRELLRSRDHRLAAPPPRRGDPKSGGERLPPKDLSSEKTVLFQKEMEAKALVIARLEARIKELERRLKEIPDDPSSGGTTKKKLEEMRLEMAAKDLRLAEMEVKLEELLRLKTDFDEKAQDIIEEKTRAEKELGKKCNELSKEKEALSTEVELLKAEIERVVVDKEKVEEKLQSSSQEWESEREKLYGELTSGQQRVSKLEEELGWLARVKDEDLSDLREDSQKELAAREASIEELKAAAARSEPAHEFKEGKDLQDRIGGLEEELERYRKEAREAAAALESASGEVESLQGRIQDLERGKDHSKEELESLYRRLDEERESRRAEEEEKERLEAQLAKAEAGLEERKEKERSLRLRAEEDKEELETRLAEVEAGLREMVEQEKTQRLKTEEEKDELAARLAEAEAGLKENGDQEFTLRLKIEEEKEALVKRLAEVETGLKETDQKEKDLRLRAGKEKEELETRLAEVEAGLRETAEQEKTLRLKIEEEKEELAERFSQLETELKEIAEKEKDHQRRFEEEKGRAEDYRIRIEELESLMGDREEALEGSRDEAASLKESLEGMERSLAAEKAAKKAVEDEYQLQLLSEKEEKRDLEDRLKQMTKRLDELDTTEEEKFDQLRDKLIGAVKLAQEEIIERSRAEADLAARLESQEREKEEQLRRMEGELTRAHEREKRLEELLDRSMNRPLGFSSNLPARISSDLLGGGSRSRVWIFVGLTLGALLLLGALTLSLFGGKIREPERADKRTAEAPSPGIREGSLRGIYPGGGDLDADQGKAGEIWQKWTRWSASGGVILQATMRSPEEMNASLEAEAAAGKWSPSELSMEQRRRLNLFDFDSNFYFYIYVKNLEAGYPSYADNLQRHLYLRDDAGNEVVGSLPEDMAGGKIIYSHSPGPLAKENREMLYQVAAWIVFPRNSLKPEPRFLQLIAYDIGATSRRVLTWEIAGQN
jgi:DNA-binding response OmpR family regulator